MTDAALDEAWRPTAEAARECIRLLGYPSAMTLCLPGEEASKGCDGTVAQHALSYFAVLRAIVDHQLIHLNMPAGMFQRIYRQALADIDCAH